MPVLNDKLLQTLYTLLQIVQALCKEVNIEPCVLTQAWNLHVCVLRNQLLSARYYDHNLVGGSEMSHIL